MNWQITILPAAEEDIAEAATWYDEKERGLGGEFLDEVARAVGALTDSALHPRVRYPRKEVRWIYPERFPYRICYYVEGEFVRIFGVIHAKRRDREWRRRV